MNANSNETKPFPDDTQWLVQVSHGDEDAARALVKRLSPTVLRSIRCHRPRQISEEDLAQMVFAKIFSKLHQFSGTVPLEHWVSRITVNTCISQLSREKVRPELRMSDLTEEEETLIQRLHCTESDLPSDRTRDAREVLEKLLAALTPDERLVVAMLHLEERPIIEISQLTGWSVSRVKVKAFRARGKMRNLWTRLMKRTQSPRQASFLGAAIETALQPVEAAA